jgi:hypothetical protein
MVIFRRPITAFIDRSKRLGVGNTVIDATAAEQQVVEQAKTITTGGSAAETFVTLLLDPYRAETKKSILEDSPSARRSIRPQRSGRVCVRATSCGG